jgi:hypothetical protein
MLLLLEMLQLIRFGERNGYRVDPAQSNFVARVEGWRPKRRLVAALSLRKLQYVNIRPCPT